MEYGRCGILIIILVLKHQYLFHSGCLYFGLKPGLKTGSLPGAKAPGYSSIRQSLYDNTLVLFLK